MIHALSLLAVASLQGSEASKLVSGMFTAYHQAKSLSGTIVKTQSAGTAKGVTTTKFQIDRTSRRLYILQEMRTPSIQRRWLVTADGKHFSYDEPDESAVRKGNRLVERMELDGKPLDEKHVYSAAAASLGDRELPLDVIVAGKIDLEFVRGQIDTLEVVRKDKVGESEVTVIGGLWKDRPADRYPVAKYELWIDSANHLRRFVHQQDVSIQDNSGKTPVVRIVSVWDVTVTIGGTLDESLFKVVL